MKKFLPHALALISIAFASCSTVTLKNTSSQEISWGNLSMKVPATWTAEPQGSRLNLKGNGRDESLLITSFTFPAKKLTPNQIIQHAVEGYSKDTPNESRTIVPYRMFRLKCGEPAAVVVKDLGDNYYTVSYAIASTNNMFNVDFYRKGSPTSSLDFYQKMINSISIEGFSESTCK